MNRVSPISRSHPARADAADGSASPRYWAYLSYSHRDEADAKWLHAALEKFAVPPTLVGRDTAGGPAPKSFRPIFRDRQELAASGDLGHDIREALAGSRFLIVLCSPAAAASHWTNQEIATFKRLHPRGAILAAIIAGEPWASLMPGRESEECFPPALRVVFDLRGRPTAKRSEPIAADLREGRDGRRMGMLKVAAGMLGVGLDDLVHREAQRRQKRLTYIAAASLAGMTLTSGLAVFAFDKRDEARDQRREAEGLVGFMLGDLRGKLEPLGRLDALDAVGARALAYFEKQDKSELSDAALAQRSRALTMMGEIASSRGDLDGALRRYHEAMTGTAEALRREPDDPQRIFDHAQNVYWVGEIALQRGQMDRAEVQMREYKRLAGQLIAFDPSKSEWQMEGIYADANLGIVLWELGRYPDAAAIFQSSLAEIEKLALAAPQNAEYRKSLIETLAWLADAREKQGRIEDALTQRTRQIGLLTPLIDAPKSDVDNKRQLVVAHRAAGRLFAMRGDLSASVDHLGQAVRIGHELMRTEPDNASWAGIAATSYLDLGELQLAAGQADQAGNSARVGCNIGDRLIGRDSSVKSWRVDLRIACLSLRARLALVGRASDEARIRSDQLVKLARTEADKDASTESRLMLSNAELLRGIIASATGDPEASQGAYQAALLAWPTGVALTPQLTGRQVLILDGLGRRAEAKAGAAKLEAMGYRHPTYLSDRMIVKRREGEK